MDTEAIRHGLHMLGEYLWIVYCIYNCLSGGSPFEIKWKYLSHLPPRLQNSVSVFRFQSVFCQLHIPSGNGLSTAPHTTCNVNWPTFFSTC